MASTPSPVSVMSASAVRNRVTAWVAARASRSPEAVSTTSRGRRENRVWPSRCSIALICQLTAAWVMFSSSAARVKLFRRAAASKTRMALSGMAARGSDIRLAYA